MKTPGGYDVAIIGGGPVGTATALSFAARGQRVLLLEANARAATRLAGEWLHPPAVEILTELGVDLGTSAYPTGRGFTVLPDDGSAPIVLPYAGGRAGASLHHESLVATLRRCVVASGLVDYVEGARVAHVEGTRVTYRLASGVEKDVDAGQVVGASGRTGVSHRVLGIESRSRTYSRMGGVLLKDVTLPHEGYGHLCLGAPGPVLVYRIGPSEVRVCFDVPLWLDLDDAREATLHEAYAPALPLGLRAAFKRALVENDVLWAANQTRLRRHFGRPGFALVGDAVGHHHPLTAAGLTLGVMDGVALARAKSFAAYVKERDHGGRVSEVLAIALYDIFAGTSDETVAMRRGVYQLWRESAPERTRTMRLLAGDVSNLALFGTPFLKVVGKAAGGLLTQSLDAASLRNGVEKAERLASAAKAWVSSGALHLYEAPETGATDVVAPPEPEDEPSADGQRRPELALDAGLGALLALQDDDGSWEGESSWCALLSAEYTLAWHVMGLPMDERRRRRVLLHFERTRLPEGVWGLSEVSPPSLFVTTLVYVAARVLGAAPDDPLLARARAFLDREGGALAIPTWGKFWLCLLSLYRWEGVNPLIPELWALPTAVPVHPARYYCHTRLIYMAMATLYAERFQARPTPLTETLRRELFPQGFDSVDFAEARKLLRPGDLFAEPSRILKLSYEGLRAVDRVRRGSRDKLLRKFRDAIRWELKVSSHTSISPVSGLLNILALWSRNPQDPDVLKAIERMECWFWEDDRDGLRVTGARSAIWDTSFALQTLAAAAPHSHTASAMSRASEFLRDQQIRTTFPGYVENHRADPKGGYPFSFVWHGWPVSDCTAEAVLGRLELSGADAPSDDDVAMAAAFILSAQGPDGGFGSYEKPRVPFSLEWLNPAEMFGDSMTEVGYVECTASCISALAKVAALRPHLMRDPKLAGILRAVQRGAESIRRKQRPEGYWVGAWAVRMIYGTWFGVRGLLAAGAPPTDPAIRKACAWLKSVQRPDGGWGERMASSPDYVPHAEANATQTGWALMMLCEAEDPDFRAAERAARHLARAQLGSGEWPRQEPVGVFFQTALLDYALYKSYFPVWALAMFETRRKARAPLSKPSRSFTRQLAPTPELRVGADGE